ncbi:hypothetical protein MKZ38_010231 [Zalerion maritima]|uniref:Uncharacterized protein n=1 Tax=Zalerion maritima TaxID=339359 RepID=A0AAD5RSH8_9PEZI|nr:hypothetical protein MKZ38_010231 [Zalerion maritima]
MVRLCAILSQAFLDRRRLLASENQHKAWYFYTRSPHFRFGGSRWVGTITEFCALKLIERGMRASPATWTSDLKPVLVRRMEASRFGEGKTGPENNGHGWPCTTLSKTTICKHPVETAYDLLDRTTAAHEKRAGYLATIHSATGNIAFPLKRETVEEAYCHQVFRYGSVLTRRLADRHCPGMKGEFIVSSTVEALARLAPPDGIDELMGLDRMILRELEMYVDVEFAKGEGKEKMEREARWKGGWTEEQFARVWQELGRGTEGSAWLVRDGWEKMMDGKYIVKRWELYPLTRPLEFQLPQYWKGHSERRAAREQAGDADDETEPRKKAMPQRCSPIRNIQGRNPHGWGGVTRQNLNLDLDRD